MFIYLLHCIMYICLSTYAKEKNSSIRKSYLRTTIFQKRFYLVGLREQLCLQNDKKLSIKEYTKQLKRGGVQNRRCTPISEERGLHLTPCTPPWIRAWDTYIIILFLSNLHMHSNVTVLPIKQNYNIVPNLHAYNIPSS